MMAAPSRPENLTPTQSVLWDMLKENTGIAMCDSGGDMQPDGTVLYGYGRSWQVNQRRNFLSEPRAVLSIDTYDDKLSVGVTYNLFHWLDDRLEFDEEIQKEFDTFAESKPDDGWLTIMEEFLDSKTDITGIYGDGKYITDNSYNSENNLSQTIQYCYWEDDGGQGYVLLQIHGGCDVRGGYTAPKAFRCTDEMSIFGYADGQIGCRGCDVGWYTDDAYHWYFNWCADGHDITELHKYRVKELESDVTAEEAKKILSEERKGPEDFVILTVIRQGRKVLLCPVCGEELEAI